jgi:hypothetical protein
VEKVYNVGFRVLANHSAAFALVHQSTGFRQMTDDSVNDSGGPKP